MPYTTLVAGTTITASWANASVRDQVVTPFASSAARASAVTSPVKGMVSFLNDVNSLEVYNGTQWVPTAPNGANVDTLESTASTTYTDLSTPGPAVTLITGTAAIVWLTAYMSNSGAGNNDYISFAVSGASTVAAADARAASQVGTNPNTAGAMFKITGLTAGSNVFTCKYRASAGTGNFVFRNIVVQALP